MVSWSDIKRDAQERPFTYILYTLQIVLAAAFPILVLQLDGSLNEAGCRYALNASGSLVGGGLG